MARTIRNTFKIRGLRTRCRQPPSAMTLLPSFHRTMRWMVRTFGDNLQIIDCLMWRISAMFLSSWNFILYMRSWSFCQTTMKPRTSWDLRGMPEFLEVHRDAATCQGFWWWDLGWGVECGSVLHYTLGQLGFQVDVWCLWRVWKTCVEHLWNLQIHHLVLVRIKWFFQNEIQIHILR